MDKTGRTHGRGEDEPQCGSGFVRRFAAGRASVSLFGQGHMEVVQLLLDSFVDVESPTMHQSNAFMLAACCDKTGVMQLLLERRANKDVVDTIGYHSLHRAAELGNLEVCRVLLAWGFDLKDATEGMNGFTALHLAVKEGPGFAMQVLLFYVDITFWGICLSSFPGSL